MVSGGTELPPPGQAMLWEANIIVCSAQPNDTVEIATDLVRQIDDLAAGMPEFIVVADTPSATLPQSDVRRLYREKVQEWGDRLHGIHVSLGANRAIVLAIKMITIGTPTLVTFHRSFDDALARARTD